MGDTQGAIYSKTNCSPVDLKNKRFYMLPKYNNVTGRGHTLSFQKAEIERKG